MAAKKKLSGNAAMIASGKRAVTVYLDAEQHAAITTAAELDARKVPAWVAIAATAAAEKRIKAKGSK